MKSEPGGYGDYGGQVIKKGKLGTKVGQDKIWIATLNIHNLMGGNTGFGALCDGSKEYLNLHPEEEESSVQDIHAQGGIHSVESLPARGNRQRMDTVSLFFQKKTENRRTEKNRSNRPPRYWRR